MQFHAISIMCNNNIYESIIIHHLTTCILRQEPSCSHVRWGCCEGLFIGVAAGRWPCSRRQNGWRGFRFRYVRCVEMMQWPFDSRTLDAAMRLCACVCVCARVCVCVSDAGHSVCRLLLATFVQPFVIFLRWQRCSIEAVESSTAASTYFTSEYCTHTHTCHFYISWFCY